MFKGIGLPDPFPASKCLVALNSGGGTCSDPRHRSPVRETLPRDPHMPRRPAVTEPGLKGPSGAHCQGRMGRIVWGVGHQTCRGGVGVGTPIPPPPLSQGRAEGGGSGRSSGGRGRRGRVMDVPRQRSHSPPSGEVPHNRAASSRGSSGGWAAGRLAHSACELTPLTSAGVPPECGFPPQPPPTHTHTHTHEISFARVLSGNSKPTVWGATGASPNKRAQYSETTVLVICGFVWFVRCGVSALDSVCRGSPRGAEESCRYLLLCHSSILICIRSCESVC